MSVVREEHRGDEPGKYVIFKRDEFTRLVDEGRLTHPSAYFHSIEGFVLRPTDIFGSAALWAYAHLLQTAEELGRLRPGTFTEEELTRLGEASEEVAHMAEDWQRRGVGRKVPD